jgi:hypothetical protein
VAGLRRGSGYSGSKKSARRIRLNPWNQ